MLIETRDLSKFYGQNPACSKICLSVEEGQVFGLLGPNGAGKSTLIKMLLGLAWPSSGQAFIKGQSVNNLSIRKTIGYLPELFRLYEWLTAQELLVFYARSYGLSKHEHSPAIAEALELVGLQGREKERIKGYSKGMQQRLALAGAILHHPLLLFLDEPTSALDPIGRRDIRDLISILKAQGTTIFLNSHLLSEVEMTCTHLGFINHGKLVAQGNINEFLQDKTQITIETQDIDTGCLDDWSQRNRISEINPDRIVISLERKAEVPLIINELVLRGVPVYGMDINSRGLEEVFLDLMGDKGGLG
ncbi:MAG: ABC transporter ATP-binding protein [Syntrophomonadaceae bacterium]|nr:ABC transporter ATP-binding protein [Syntrophomonadaceae bacterium]